MLNTVGIRKFNTKYRPTVHTIKQVYDKIHNKFTINECIIWFKCIALNKCTTKYIIREMRLDVVYKRGQLATSRKNAAAW